MTLFIELNNIFIIGNGHNDYHTRNVKTLKTKMTKKNIVLKQNSPKI